MSQVNASFETPSVREPPHSIGIGLKNEIKLIRTSMLGEQSARPSIQVEQQGTILSGFHIAFDPADTGVARPLRYWCNAMQ
jgi:hypothetical protein